MVLSLESLSYVNLTQSIVLFLCQNVCFTVFLTLAKLLFFFY